MKGIYLTQEAKQEIEAKIAELEKDRQHWLRQHWLDNTVKHIETPNYNSLMDSIKNQAKADQAVYLLKEILQLAIILPVEESFYTVENKVKHHCGTTGCSKDVAVFREYPNGVIIKSKI